MLRKILSVVIACVMVMLSIPLTTFATEQTDETQTGSNIVSYKNDDGVFASTEIEGSIIRCEYISDSDEYYLYRDDMIYPLKVEIGDDYVLVDIIDDIEFNNTLDDTLVYGQNPVALAFAYWTPEAIAAAEAVICSMMAYAAGKITYFSVNSIATTIKGVKNGNISQFRLKTQAGITSYWALKFCRKKQQNNYYMAMIKNNTVYIGPLITYGVAKYRLKAGYDIFATNASTAKYLADTASPARASTYHPAHRAGEGYYPHFHPVGVGWYLNRRHNPHVWYPYT